MYAADIKSEQHFFYKKYQFIVFAFIVKFRMYAADIKFDKTLSAG